jgi:hypothetical protein
MIREMAKLDVYKFKVGDVFYGIKESNNAFHRNKIHQVIDGEDWFKYELPLVTYEIAIYRVLGILTKHLEGEWEPGSDYEFLTEIFVSFECNKDGKPIQQKFSMYTDDMDSEKYFLDKDSAQHYIEQKYLYNKEIDRK